MPSPSIGPKNFLPGLYNFGSVKRTKIEKKYCKKAINFPTDFSLAHCGKELYL